MISRRTFGKTFGGTLGTLALASTAGFEAAYAQRALVGNAPAGTIWLNANEHPDGPCPAAITAMSQVLTMSGRYHYQEFPEFYATVARSEQLESPQILVGSGSSEILHAGLEAFTSSTRPLILSSPTYEFPEEVARAAGHPVISVPLRADFSADVKRIAEEAAKAPGGMIYLCNPNNPTASITTKSDIAWLVANLPSGVVLMVDEAYIHFADSPQVASALPYVREGKNVVVTRTFSKIYGMAGLRVGFAAAKPELIQKMTPYRNNVISYVSARAVTAALADKDLIPKRRAQMAATRKSLCDWLTTKNMRFIDPQANFMMIDIGRESTTVAPRMLERGVAVGRRFPALSKMMRVTIGTDQEMAKFRQAFWEVMQSA